MRIGGPFGGRFLFGIRRLFTLILWASRIDCTKRGYGLCGG